MANESKARYSIAKIFRQSVTLTSPDRIILKVVPSQFGYAVTLVLTSSLHQSQASPVLNFLELRSSFIDMHGLSVHVGLHSVCQHNILIVCVGAVA